MKKALYLFAAAVSAFALTFPAMACCAPDGDEWKFSKKFDEGNFTEIIASGNYEIEVIKGNGCSVEVFYQYEESERLIDVKKKGNAIVLGLTENSFPKKLWKKEDYTKMKVIIHVKDLISIDMSGACSLDSKDTFVSENFYIQLSGAAELDHLKVDGKTLRAICSGASELSLENNHVDTDIKISGSSNVEMLTNSSNFRLGASGACDIEIELTGNDTLEATASGAVSVDLRGKGEEATIKTSGAAGFDATEYTCRKVKVNGSGASGIKLNVTSQLDVTLTGASSLRYKGTPEITNLSVSTGSSFKKIE